MSTGRCKRQAGDVYKSTDTTLSVACSAASNRQDYSIFGDNPRQESEGQKLLLDPPSQQPDLTDGVAGVAQLHTSSFPRHVSPSGDSPNSRADL